MSTILGSASRARELARLFEAWRLACDRQDTKAMAAAKRAIDEVVADRGEKTSSKSEARRCCWVG